MLTMGISGGLDLIHQNREYLFPRGACHDAAAVLVEDGRVVAAIEEERLNRIKHTSKGPVNAIKFCLDLRGLSLNDLDALVFYGSEEMCAAWLRNLFYSSCEAEPVTTMRQLVHDLLDQGVGQELDDRKLMFVHHHVAHAVSAFVQSGLRESLVLTVDGSGDSLCGTVSRWRGAAFEILRSFNLGQSLGLFYDRIIAIIGYGFTEEYKVMGLAPYGDPARYRQAFRNLYVLLPGGDYLLRWELIDTLYALVPVRKKGEPITKEHVDLAAALQEALEAIVFHILTYYRAVTGMTSLCMAGGVAHNSTLNGKLLYSGLFKEMFVQPASHDGGCAIGAALCPQVIQLDGRAGPLRPLDLPVGRVSDVYWGTDVGAAQEVAAELRDWDEFIEVEYVDQIEARTAALLAEGRVVGWVQGRSEFGPRALGNRSILADPRPPENKELINKMIKKREGYRPFAPSVLEEYADEYFDIPIKDMRFPFMSFTVQVKPEKRALLGATTHVDGSARIQTVSRSASPRFWDLIEAFRQLTGVPVLLNTSFNNNVEPIVDSAGDAVVCFLTTDLDYLIVGNYLIGKKPPDPARVLQCAASLPAYIRLVTAKSVGHAGEYASTYEIANSYDPTTIPISKEVYELLLHSSGRERISDLLAARAEADDREAVARSLFELWSKRVVILRPRRCTEPACFTPTPTTSATIKPLPRL